MGGQLYLTRKIDDALEKLARTYKVHKEGFCKVCGENESKGSCKNSVMPN
jgi:hypothetical protein